MSHFFFFKNENAVNSWHHTPTGQKNRSQWLLLFNLKYIYGASTPLTEKEGQKTAFTLKSFFHDNFNWSKKMTKYAVFSCQIKSCSKADLPGFEKFKRISMKTVHDRRHTWHFNDYFLNKCSRQVSLMNWKGDSFFRPLKEQGFCPMGETFSRKFGKLLIRFI